MFTAEEIEAMPPSVRTEIQGRIVLVDTKRRDFLASGQPERRHPGKKRHYERRWPRQVWPVNDWERAEMKRIERLLVERAATGG